MPFWWNRDSRPTEGADGLQGGCAKARTSQGQSRLHEAFHSSVLSGGEAGGQMLLMICNTSLFGDCPHQA